MNIGHGWKETGDVRVWLLPALTVVILMLSACFIGVRDSDRDGHDSHSGETVYVSEAPPPPRTDVIVGIAPSSTHIWVDGSWTRQHDSWSWESGRWAARPHQGAQWVSGRWNQHPRGYVWVGGYWR